jgi:hypothetical protein
MLLLAQSNQRDPRSWMLVAAVCTIASIHFTYSSIDPTLTFTVSGAQAILIDTLNFCGNGIECIYGVNCAAEFIGGPK